MMQWTRLTLFVSLLVISSCYDPPDFVTYEVAIEETIIHDEFLTIRFAAVAEDTRCPPSIDCQVIPRVGLTFEAVTEEGTSSQTYFLAEPTFVTEEYYMRVLEVLPRYNDQPVSEYRARILVAQR